MVLKGTVTNVTNFGAFVDIGVHQDGLVHISELSDQFVKNASEVVAVGAVLDVRILEVDVARRRISLSCKSQQVPKTEQRPPRQDQPRGGPQEQGQRRDQRPGAQLQGQTGGGGN